MKLKKWFGATALLAIAAFGLAACSSSTSKNAKSADSATVTVKVGVMSLSDTEEARWNKVQEILDKDKAGVKLEFTQFTDYSQPNQAVRDGDVDINAFQHYYYLKNWNKENNADLVSVADTYIAPIRLYSGTKDGKNKYTDVKDIPENGSIAVPNDATNESRALDILANAGLIKLNDNPLKTPLDIVDNPKKLKFEEIETAQVPRTLDDVTIAVINTNYALNANLNPTKDALVIESKDSPYVNYVVVKAGNENSPKTKALDKAINSPEVKKFIETKYNGAIIPAF